MVSAPYARKNGGETYNCRSCRQGLYLEINFADRVDGHIIIASEASFLVCSMRGFSIYIYVYIYISGRTSCRKCSKCFYVYLNIRPVQYSARIESVANARRQQLRTACQLRTAQSPKERDAHLQQLRTAREQTIATESTEAASTT